MLLRPLLARRRRLLSCTANWCPLLLLTWGRGALVAGGFWRRIARDRRPLALACRGSAGRADGIIVRLRRISSVVPITLTVVPLSR